MKLYRTLVNAVTDTLRKIFREGRHADKAVEEILKSNPRFGSRDRKFIAENVYGMVRWWRLLTETAGTDENFLRLFAIWSVISGRELPDWEEFGEIDNEKILAKHSELLSVRKYRESVPDWLDEMACRELGEPVWTKELHALNQEAAVVLRVNELKTSVEQLQQMLAAKQVETKRTSECGLILLKRQNLQQLEEYKAGLFEIQDASSQLIAPFMELKSGMTVIDACAGAGGKSLHIAAMMKNQGRIISMDVEERKLAELERRAQRGGVSIIRTKIISDTSINQLNAKADRLLLDVPCSGLGVLKRNPDAKWKLTEQFISEIKRTQQEIISNYSEMLKPGGILVYATCSILPSENQQQVERFLDQKKNFEFIADRKIMPSEGFDGFYMAKIVKR
ncbi:MAG: RsmB/NOP family class I SAM-dependent RNA methyltransferase [Bacteroidia bacterium]